MINLIVEEELQQLKAFVEQIGILLLGENFLTPVAFFVFLVWR